MRISEKNIAILQGILIGLTNGFLIFLGVMIAFTLIGLIQ